MPIFNYKCFKCGEMKEEFVMNLDQPIYCSSCNSIMQKVFSGSNMYLLNREKPRSFKWHPEELNAEKDQWHTMKEMEEKNMISNRERDYYYNKLRDKVKH